MGGLVDGWVVGQVSEGFDEKMNGGICENAYIGG